MNDSISRQMAIQKMRDLYNEDLEAYGVEIPEMFDCDRAIRALQSISPVEVEIIRCKDCKHQPHTSDKYDYDNGDCGFEIIFPDFRCPCRCQDEYYNRLPDDDWYCGNAERKGKVEKQEDER